MAEKAIDKINKISKELKLLSALYKSKGELNYHNKAQQEINKKYGKGWREKLKIEDYNDNPYKIKMSYHKW